MNYGWFLWEINIGVTLGSVLGMTPAKEWSGRFDANGGYIIVRKDRVIVYYHFFNRNDVENYV